jgi:hypothetical protein
MQETNEIQLHQMLAKERATNAVSAAPKTDNTMEMYASSAV